MSFPELSDALASFATETTRGSIRQRIRQPSDNRRHIRYDLELAMVVRGGSDPKWLYNVRTVNVSSGGVLFLFDHESSPDFHIGDGCRVEIELIPATALHDRVLLRGRGAIVRVVLSNTTARSVQVAVNLASSNILRT